MKVQVGDTAERTLILTQQHVQTFGELIAGTASPMSVRFGRVTKGCLAVPLSIQNGQHFSLAVTRSTFSHALSGREAS